MTDQTNKQRPVETHRDGRLTAAIWENQGEHGKIYNTTFAYSYQDKEGNWRDTASIPGHELLKAANLAQTAYSSVQRLKDQDRAHYVEQEQAQLQLQPEREQSPER